MIRSKKETQSKKPVWKKMTRGTLYPFPNQRNIKIEKNETVEATQQELGRFINQFELIQDGTGEYKINTTKPVQSSTFENVEKETYRVEKMKDVEGGLYEVIASSGKVMADDLTLKKAEALKAQLEKETVEE